MAGQRITKRLVDNTEPGVSERTIWDSEISGFGLRVRPNGVKSYVLVYRAGHGRKAPVRKLTLGTVGKLTPEEARSLSRRALGSVAHGGDPAADRAEDRKGLTVAELAEAFLKEHVRPKRKGSTAGQYEHVIRAYIIPAIGGEKADGVKRAGVARLHLKLQDTPATANYTIAVVGSMYGFAARRGYVPEGFNPAFRIEKYAEKRRERFLTTDELGRVGDALREAETVGIPWDVDESKPTAKHIPKTDRRTIYDPYAVAALRLLLFTGCRLREVLHLRWEYVDHERGLLFLPDSKTGRKTVVLNAPALAILASLAELPQRGSYVVPGNDPERPRHDLKKIWAAVSRRAGVAGVRIHDLRHTFASYGAGGGFGLPIVGKLLGHSQAATTERYAHLDADPLRRASERIGGTIAAALDRKNEGQVVPLRN